MLALGRCPHWRLHQQTVKILSAGCPLELWKNCSCGLLAGQRQSRLCPAVSHSGKSCPRLWTVIYCINCGSVKPGVCCFIIVELTASTIPFRKWTEKEVCCGLLGRKRYSALPGSRIFSLKHLHSSLWATKRSCCTPLSFGGRQTSLLTVSHRRCWQNWNSNGGITHDTAVFALALKIY